MNTYRIRQFFASLNVFATIRDLRDVIGDLQDANRHFVDANAFLDSEAAGLDADLREANHNLVQARQANFILRQQRDTAVDAGLQVAYAADLATAALEVADQVIDAHMDEREELIAEINDLALQADEQAQDTLETIAYIKQVEAALTAAGITVQDGPFGPIVVIDEEAFLATVTRNGPAIGGKLVIASA